ncbi:hypothetical protein V8E54_003861 [Elaphomyces granulatus]
MKSFAQVSRLAVFVLLVKTGTAASSFLPGAFTAWYWQSSLVVDTWLYIDGGEIWGRWYDLNTSTVASLVWNLQTMAIDLTSSWTTSSVTVVATNKSVEVLESSSLLGRRPDMWYDPTADLVYSIGGLSYNIDGQLYDVDMVPTLWGFKPQSNGSVEWKSQSSTTNPQSAVLASNVAGGLSATSPTGHYNLGGFIEDYVENKINSFALEEMFSYNSGNQSWYNLTLAGQHYVWGEAQYVPIYGARGVVLFFGGFWPSDHSVGSPSSLATLDTILVYDIYTNRFFKQQTSNPPPGRAFLCSVAAGASNNESYEIFIYGGTQDWVAPISSQSLADDLGSVYILTVPAFQWLQAPNQSPIRRQGHTCSIIGKRQMLSIGGTQEASLENQDDPWPNGLGIFDMTTLSWTNVYDAAAPAYEQPSLVSQFYANNSRYPIEWGDPELESIFTSPNGTATTNVSSGNTSNNTRPGITTNRTTSMSDGIANHVVGGVIGGIAALAIIASLIYWRRRRYKRREKPSQNPAELVTDECISDQVTCRELAVGRQAYELPV